MNTPHLPRGPVMADVAAYHLTEEEKQRLLDPAVGGVILFRRNFETFPNSKLWFKKSKPSVHLNSSSPSTTKADGFNVLLTASPACLQ